MTTYLVSRRSRPQGDQSTGKPCNDLTCVRPEVKNAGSTASLSGIRPSAGVLCTRASTSPTDPVRTLSAVSGGIDDRLVRRQSQRDRRSRRKRILFVAVASTTAAVGIGLAMALASGSGLRTAAVADPSAPFASSTSGYQAVTTIAGSRTNEPGGSSDRSLASGTQSRAKPGAGHAPRPHIVQKPIPFSANRRKEMAAYAKRHYGVDDWRLAHPHVIVEHYTASESFASAYNTFASDTRDSELARAARRLRALRDRQGRHDLPARADNDHVSAHGRPQLTAIGIEHVGRATRKFSATRVSCARRSHSPSG